MDAARFATFLATVVSPSVVGLLAERLKVGEIEALRKFYLSAVYAALSDEGTKVWHFSPQLITSLVEEELRTGHFTYPQEAL